MLYEVATSSDKTFKLYRNMWHALLYGETPENSEIVFGDITSWLEERAIDSSGGLESQLKHTNDEFLKHK